MFSAAKALTMKEPENRVFGFHPIFAQGAQ